MPHTSTPLRRVFGAALIIAPVVSLISTVVYVAGGGLNDDQAGGVIQVYGVIAYAVAIFALIRLLEEPLPRFAAVVTVLGMMTVAAGVAFGNDSIVHAINSSAALSEQGNSAAS